MALALMVLDSDARAKVRVGFIRVGDWTTATFGLPPATDTAPFGRSVSCPIGDINFWGMIRQTAFGTAF
jgi:hypothetical protein